MDQTGYNWNIVTLVPVHPAQDKAAFVKMQRVSDVKVSLYSSKVKV